MPAQEKPSSSDPSPPKHMAASMRVVASHAHVRHVSLAAARDEVQQAASRIESGTAGPETERRVARLEKVTGCAIAELAKHAQPWC